MGDGRWGGSDTGGESAEHTETGGEWAHRKKRERRRARWSRRNKEPGRISEGGKRKGPHHHDGTTYKINIKGTESRGNLSLCSGMELHHPIMSKLWDLGGHT